MKDSLSSVWALGRREDGSLQHTTCLILIDPCLMILLRSRPLHCGMERGIVRVFSPMFLKMAQAPAQATAIGKKLPRLFSVLLLCSYPIPFLELLWLKATIRDLINFCLRVELHITFGQQYEYPMPIRLGSPFVGFVSSFIEVLHKASLLASTTSSVVHLACIHLTVQ